MTGFARLTIAAGLLGGALAASGAEKTAVSIRAAADIAPEANPDSAFWKDAPGVIAEADPFGKIVAGHRSEIRSRWTNSNLYLLFICPYQQLYLKPDGDTKHETYGLWEWDVAEAFLGTDFTHIRRYREFEVSPRGEWVDLDIDLDKPHHEDGWKWNSGMQLATRIDEQRHVWYAVMRIPWSALSAEPPHTGQELRANFYRAQGPPPHRNLICWQPTHTPTFHTPTAFGRLRLAEK
jgi:hypothetical protein